MRTTSLITPIARIQEGEVVTVKGMIVQSRNEMTRRGFRFTKITIQDETARLTLTWINQPPPGARPERMGLQSMWRGRWSGSQENIYPTK